MPDTAAAFGILSKADRELQVISMAEERAANAGLPAPQTVPEFMAWIADEIEIQESTPKDDPYYKQAMDYALAMRVVNAELQQEGFQPGPSPFASPRVRLEYADSGLNNIHLEFDETEAKGKLRLEMGAYGVYVFYPEFSDSDPLFLIDLFHNSPASRDGVDPDVAAQLDQAERLAGASLQVQLVLYGIDRGDPLGFVKFWPDRTLVTFDPSAAVVTDDENQPRLPIIGFIDEE